MGSYPFDQHAQKSRRRQGNPQLEPGWKLPGVFVEDWQYQRTKKLLKCRPPNHATTHFNSF
jgi:hypothetical protein